MTAVTSNFYNKSEQNLACHLVNDCKGHMTVDQEQARHLVDEHVSIVWPLTYVCFSRCPSRWRHRHRGGDLRGWENPSTGSQWLPCQRWRHPVSYRPNWWLISRCRQNTRRKTMVSWRGWTQPRRTTTDCVTRWECVVKWVRMCCKMGENVL